MEQIINGRIIKGLGGLYTVKPFDDAPEIVCRAKGSFRHDGITPLVGDSVCVRSDEGGNVIASIGERKNSLIRPPLANLDYLFITFSPVSPAPTLETLDKLISIAEFNRIEPVIIVSKCELDEGLAKEYADIYRLGGFDTFVLSAVTGEGIAEVKSYINAHLTEKTAAFAGASGVGKSTLMNSLFGEAGLTSLLETSDVSKKTERGRHTTRHVELFTVSCVGGDGYIADTPGFSMIDFVRFDFFTKDDLPHTMREFSDCIGKCRYKKCTHLKEDGCAVIEKMKRGGMAKSRHESFVAMYEALKNKHEWQ